MSMRWSIGSMRIRWRLAAISGGNCIGAERRAIGGFAALSRRSSVAAQHRLSARRRRWTAHAYADIQRCGSDQPINVGVELRARK